MAKNTWIVLKHITFNLDKTDKSKTPQDVKPKQTVSLKRTPSNKSRDLSNGTVTQGQVLPTDVLSKDDNFESLQRKSSQLCKSLQEILQDKNSLGYFIQFLEARKAGQMIRFWLDAESFKASTWSRIRSHSLNVTKKKKNSASKKLDDYEAGCNIQKSSDSIQYSCADSSTDTSKPTSEKYFTPIVSVINNSAKNQDLTQNPSSGEITQNDQNISHFDQQKSVHESAYDHNQKQYASPDSHVFHEIDKKESIKQENEDWTKKLKKSIENDAVRIFNKYLSQDATDPIGLDDLLRHQCISKICREDGEVDPECFIDSQSFSVTKMESEYFQSYIESEFHLKYQIDLLTTGTIYLSDFLYYDPAFFYFMEFMEQENGSNILQFWIAVENFEKHLQSQNSGYDGVEAQNDAMVLYDKYFSLQASHPLGFDDKCRFDVESNICREGGPLPDCFGKPREMVLKTIDKVYFCEFRQSEIFYKFLSELVGNVYSMRELPKQRKRTDSDGSLDSSTHSGDSVRSTVSSRNTLLAAGTSHFGRDMHKFENDMNIDPGLLNPDLLWKRENPRMEMGKIDDFGQFRSEFNPHPDAEKSRGPIFFKKRKEKEKEEEEMAFKIAEMIINDVTSVTQTIGAMKTECDNTQAGGAIKSFSDKSES